MKLFLSLKINNLSVIGIGLGKQELIGIGIGLEKKLSCIPMSFVSVGSEVNVVIC